MAKQTGKRRIYVAILVLAGAALAVDRLLLLPPEAGAGGPEVHPLAVTSTATDVETTIELPPEAPQRITIADRLDRMAEDRAFDLTNVPDAFLPSPEWLNQGHVTPPGQSAAELFKQKHSLTGVMAAEKGGYAIVDGKMLFIGQVLDGFTLREVHRRSAVLESNGERVVLTLPE